MLLPLLFGTPAQARPRDEAMAGAYRCAAISESRRWLDCYYGAAQPVRAVLGLAPAPPAQTNLVQSPVAGSEPPPGDAGVRYAVMHAAAGCGNLAEDRGWLDCYYAAAQPMRATLHLAPAPQARTAPPRDTGMPALSASSVDAGPVVSQMQDYSFDKYGFFTVTLSNGQVWRQIDGDTDYAHWTKPASRYQVRITTGFMKSHNFQVKGLPGLYKVQRVS